ncbi:GNAT family N-acetyltransferase [Chelativorans sp. YIM 93263]|uniref:GNAT family N-acetyltransferase n=1 Tax=Chelativorans sp. YIM 93263 TaxID=2906648 RepID=UPI0023799E1A|nr:GNAT family N-acetyltransferase [Chelativorans sp. YIM 93263]
MHGPELGRIEATIRAKIRPCQKEDLPALEWMGLYRPDRHIIRETFEMQQRGEALMLLAVSADFPIAQVWIDFARKRAEQVAVLWAIRTFFPLQGAGIGRQMMHAAERVARHRGFHSAQLKVDADNDRASSFYRNRGWRPIGWDEHGRRVMTKELNGL